MTEPLRIIKIGGSLLGRTDLHGIFQSWLSRQPDACNVCVVGGGEIVDELRRDQIRIHMDDESAHWAAIDRMCKNTIELASQLGAQSESRLDQVRSFVAAADPILGPQTIDPYPPLFFDVNQWLRERSEQLPQDWSVSSDSIAAALALDLDADELVLLKSCDSDPGATFEQLSAQGVVDEYFPKLADLIPAIRCENLLRGWLES